MPTSLNMNFQESANNFMKHLNLFHDHMMMMIILNLITITYWTSTHIISNKSWTDKFESNELEVFWTSMPIALLLFISFPSMLILYMTEETQNPSITIKATSNQWYWNYYYPEMKNLSFDSFMLNKSNLRLLEVNNNLIVPSNKWIRIITTSNDVIHSWAIPSLGMKIDSIPGRLNTTMFKIKRSGFLTGQCSEICGMNHSFMPIMIQAMNPKSFFQATKM